MIQLKYKTRGNTQPDGKSKVLFTCHPADFSVYFDEISNQILNKQDCAVWYADQVFTRDEDYFDILRQMQLLVIPVTSNLLNDLNDALDEDFRFAIENHIPVLPLMQESGLEKLFNQKCGDLQFLDQNIIDETAISYEEKLEKYLSSVLLSDTDAKKIRAAFDAYIFLSYRKKDRKYAQELMRLIHQNPLLWNVAIWYDEFLVPGENFNDAIRSAIEKSNLFMLAVTPNMVNETNYVMTTEYPFAQAIGKPMLACELLPTDANSLANQFKGLPDCLDPRNTEMLDSALNTALQLDKTEHTDPIHAFFLGLAYLGGVDVETDADRSAELITRAAEANLPEAINKLIAMYTNGQGVARDYVKAYEWIEKRYELAKQSCPENATPEQLHQLFLATRTCYSDMRALGIHEVGNASLIQVMQRLEQEGGQDPVCLRDLSLCYVHMSYAKDKSEGINWCQKALDIRIALDAANRTLQTQRDLASAWNRMGYLDIERLAECSETAFALREKIAQQSGEPEDLRCLASLYEHRDIQIAVDLRRRLVQQAGTQEDFKHLKDLLSHIAFKSGNPDDAVAALEVQEQLTQFFPSVKNCKALAEAYQEVGRLHLYNKKMPQAIEAYEKAYALYLKIPSAQTEKIDICLQICDAKLRMQEKADALQTAQHAITMVWDLLETDSYKKRDAAMFWDRLSALFERLGETEQAQTCREERKKLPIRRKSPVQVRQADELSKQARECERQGRLEEANAVYIQALDILKSIPEDQVSAGAFRMQKMLYENLARLAQKTEKASEEHHWYMCLVEMCQALARSNLDHDIACLADAEKQLGGYYVRKQDYPQAEALFLQALEDLSVCLQEQFYEYARDIYLQMAAMYRTWKKADAEQEFFEKAMRAQEASDKLREEASK